MLLSQEYVALDPTSNGHFSAPQQGVINLNMHCDLKLKKRHAKNQTRQYHTATTRQRNQSEMCFVIASNQNEIADKVYDLFEL